MMMRRFPLYLACAALYAFPLFAQQDGNAPNTAAPAVALYRDHPPSYMPGEAVAVTLTITGQGMEGVRALGLEERVPEGWTLISVQEYAGDPPQVQPLPGTGPPFEFAWITPPALPCVFTYTVQVPKDAWGQQQLYGLLEYRMDLGAEQTPPTVTEIAGPEPQPPRLNLLGDNPMEVQLDTPWSEPGYAALDQNDKDISAYVSVAGTVNTASAGTYALEYKVTSPDTGLSATATRTVQVVTAPASQPASSPQPSRNPQGYRGVSTPGTGAEVTGVPQPRATTATAANTPGPENVPVDLPDLSAYRPVPAKKTGEGETTSSKESSMGGEETGLGKESAASGPEKVVSTSSGERRRDSGVPVSAPAKRRDTEGPAPIDHSPVTPPQRGIYEYLALGLVVVLGGAALAALVWRITYRPSKKGISGGKKRK